ncbi:MAG TPA: ribosome silencing factor [Planctomycetota bacterium]|nr:ribosome silencing factor [Planctomycetota bacterium]
MNGRDIALFAARIADEKKGTDIVCYNLKGMSDITDYLVIVTAHSKAQIRAIVESIHKELKQLGVRKIGREGSETGQWILLDYADCVIHVFSPQLREYYGLESVWGDAPKLEWQREAAALPATGTEGRA